jgi:hypothetical protein
MSNRNMIRTLFAAGLQAGFSGGILEWKVGS